MSGRFIIILSLGTLILVHSCSIFRKGGQELSTSSVIEGGRGVEKVCYANNISGDDLIISRVRAEYRSKEMSRSINGYIKQNKAGDILISMRSLAGIEVARASIRSDSIKIYDRINSVLYVQSIDYIERKYSISHDAICLLWGDFPGAFILEDQRDSISDDGVLNVRSGAIEYILRTDSIYAKLNSVSGLSKSGQLIEIKYSKFIENSGLIYPERSSLSMNNGETIIDMRLTGVKKERIKNMKFEVSKNAEVIVLK